MHEEIKSRCNLAVACYHSVYYCSPFDLLYRKCEDKYLTAVMLAVVLQGCAAWSVTLTLNLLAPTTVGAHINP